MLPRKERQRKSDSNLNPYTGLDAKDALKALCKDILNGVVTAVKDSVNDAKNAVTDVQKEKGTAAAALFVGKKVGKFLGQAALYTLESQIEKQAEKEGRLDEWREKKQQAADAYESIQYQAKSEPSDDDGLN